MSLLDTRLEELRRELETGQKQMDDLDNRRRETRDMLLRIGGAVQILEELVAQNPRLMETTHEANQPPTVRDR